MKNILIIQTAFIGDVILATPLISALHQKYPDAEISMLVRKGNETLVQFHPHLKEVLFWDKSSNKYANLFRLIGKVKSRKYDWVINIQRFGASGLLTFLSGAKQKTGFDKNPFSFCYTIKKKHQIGNGTHEIQRNLSLIEENPQLVRPEIFIPEKDRKVAEQYIKVPYVCMAPASVWFTKQFPLQGWVDLCDALPLDQTIYLLGAPADNALAQEIIKKTAHEKVISLCGQLNLLQSAALMAQASMNYVNDSAPMHLASAMNAPVKAIFCSTVPEFGFGPVSDSSKIIETNLKLSCRPCGLHGYKACPEGHFKCANSITTEQLL
jgi:heptosyltransferase-2